MFESDKRDTAKPLAPPQPRRKPYAPPQLTQWGEVKALTQGTGTTLTDNPTSGGFVLNA